MKTPFIVTPAGYYFETKIDLDIDKLEQAGCILFETQNQMYTHLIKVFGYDFEEVEDCDLVIKNENFCQDFMNNGYYNIDGSVESFIINFEI